jgi:hypothetical protein
VEELIENNTMKLLITSKQLNNYIKNGYLCYYIYANEFYYYCNFNENDYYFTNNNVGDNLRWSDNGHGYLES